MESQVLQERRTLDEVIVSAVEVFPNGCNYRLRKDANGSYWLEYGCFGVLVNLVTGDARLLYRWLSQGGREERRLDGEVQPETIKHLMTMEPCKLCGGARFELTADTEDRE